MFTELKLPNGQVLPNRIAKAAMEESMADSHYGPSESMQNLYKRWSLGGAGLLISGNVMVDSRHMTVAAALHLEDDSQLAKFANWASAAKTGGSKVWMQINHPGRQVLKTLVDEALAPSAVNLDLGKYSGRFAPARAMTTAQIHEVIERFANTARLAERAGFDGVQIHAAHGYLISQFLSPLVNQRTDDWGGSLTKRARLLIEVIRAVRAQVNPEFAVSVKINSADFQRGGFQPEDAIEVVKMLQQEQVDLIELSGGNYEAPAMQGNGRDHRTLAREAYFLEFAEQIAAHSQIPVMTTGGISRYEVAEKVLQQGIDVVGIATALALLPELPKQWRAGKSAAPQLKPTDWDNKTLVAIARMAQTRAMMNKHAASNKVRKQAPYWWAIARDLFIDARNTKRYKRSHS